MEEFIQQHKTVLIIAGVGIVALFALFMKKGSSSSSSTDTTAQADYQPPSGPLYYTTGGSVPTLTGSQVPGTSTGSTPSSPGQTIITPAPNPPSTVVVPTAPQQTVTTTTVAPVTGVTSSPGSGVTVTVPNSVKANAPAPVPVPALVHTGNAQPVSNYHGDISPASMGVQLAAIQQNQAAQHPNGSIVSFSSNVPNSSLAGHSYQMITDFVPGIGPIQHPDYNHPLH